MIRKKFIKKESEFEKLNMEVCKVMDASQVRKLAIANQKKELKIKRAKKARLKRVVSRPPKRSKEPQVYRVFLRKKRLSIFRVKGKVARKYQNTICDSSKYKKTFKNQRTLEKNLEIARKKSKVSEKRKIRNLILQTQEGNQRAFEILLHTFEPYIQAIANKYYLKDGEQQDLYQEGRIAFFEAIMSYRYEEGNPALERYVYLCVTRKIYSKIRHSNSLKNMVLNDAMQVKFQDLLNEEKRNWDFLMESPEDSYIKKETIAEYIELIKGCFDDMAEQVFDMRVKGYDYKTIAAILNTSPKAIDNCIQKVRKKIKKQR